MAVISFASARGSWDLLPGPCNVRSYQATMGRAAGRPERQAVPFGSVSGARNLGRAALAEPAKSPPPRGPQGKNARPPRRLTNQQLGPRFLERCHLKAKYRRRPSAVVCFTARCKSGTTGTGSTYTARILSGSVHIAAA